MGTRMKFTVDNKDKVIGVILVPLLLTVDIFDVFVVDSE